MSSTPTVAEVARRRQTSVELNGILATSATELLLNGFLTGMHKFH